MWSFLLIFVIGFASSLPLGENDENDSDSSRKVLGSSVVTSVSVIMDNGNGTKTYYADAVGKPMSKPTSGSHLASPINLLNPDKYEFYTFDTNGDLVKRLMTLDEIQGIIASGDGELLNYQSRPPNEDQPEKRVDDVVTNVQNVLKEEMEAHKIPTNTTPILDTPDVSSTWSMILPAIFGNSGGSINPDRTQVVPTPETIMLDSTTLNDNNPIAITEKIATKENTDADIEKVTHKIQVPTIEVLITPVKENFTESTTTISNKPEYSTIQVHSTSMIDVTQPGKVEPTTELLSSAATSYIHTSTEKVTTKENLNFVTPMETTSQQPLSTFFLIDTESTTKSQPTTLDSTTAKSSTNFVLHLTPEQIERLSTLLPSLKETTTFRTLYTADLNQSTVEKKEVPSTTILNSQTETQTQTYQTTETYLPAQEVDVDKLAVTELLNQLLYTTDAHEINSLSDITSDQNFDATTSMEIKESTQEVTTETLTTTSGNKNMFVESTLPPVNIKANEIINETLLSTKPMEEVQSEAATVASMIVSEMQTESLNDTLNNKDVNEAVDSLISQIIEQGTLPPLGYITSDTTQDDSTLTVPTTTNSVPSEFKTNEPLLNNSTLNDLINQNRYEEIDLEVPLSQLTTTVPEVNTTTESTTKVYIKINSTDQTFDITTLVNEILERNATESQYTTTNQDLTTEILESTPEATTESQVLTTLSSVGLKVDEQTQSTFSEPITTLSYDTFLLSTEILESTQAETTEGSTEDFTSTLTPITDSVKLQFETQTTDPPKINPEVERNSSIVSSTIPETTTDETTTVSARENATTPSIPQTTWALVSTVAPHPSTEPSEIKQNEDKEVTIDLVPKPLQGFGLEDTTASLDVDLFRFTELCNELAFRFWSSVSNGISFARSVVISPFAATSMLAMVFLGARGSTSGEMNDILKLDDMVTFNPHAIFKDVIDSIEISQKSGVAASVFAKELYSDKNKGKLLGFYKDRVKYFYDGHVEEVNFKDIGDIIRRRTNLLVKRYTWGKIPEFLKDNTLIVRPPLAGMSANIFETDCSKGSVEGRDGELHFVVLPSIRQRKLIPIPAVVWRTGFLAGYDPGLDATAVSLGSKEQTISTIFVIPGQQGTSAPGDGLFRLESRLMDTAFKQNSWSRLLRSLVPRPGLEVQIPRFAHRSVINATQALQKMGLKDLFNANKADLKGLNGLAHEMHLSDVIQVNFFATCGEGRIDETHHAEIYPATANRTFRRIRKINHLHHGRGGEGGTDEPRDYQRSFHDPLYDPSNLALPLPLRPRQARLPEAPRLRFDRPFLYFVRHNPTGLILHMGRFNPRLLP